MTEAATPSPSLQLRTNGCEHFEHTLAGVSHSLCTCTGTGPLTVSAAWMLVPSMPTSPSFCSFPGCSAKARGLTFLARICALHQHRQHELSERQHKHSVSIVEVEALLSQCSPVSALY